MIWEVVRKKEDAPNSASGGQKLDIKELLILAIATSIDALAVGVGLTLIDVNIVLAAIVIGLCTWTMVTIGIMMGRILGKMVGKRSDMIGSFVLIVVGTGILCEHIGFSPGL
mgnify:CR=1 FL=1